MTESFSRIKNYNVAVKELKDNVLFLRTLVSGGSQHSFGIHVAKMAGMPQAVLQRSKKILKQLEKSHSGDELTAKVKDLNSDMQLSFFNLDDPLLEELKTDILDTDIDRLTPVEALMKLNEIKRMLTKK
jgi:DNA mismatch repair protein MutS